MSKPPTKVPPPAAPLTKVTIELDAITLQTIQHALAALQVNTQNASASLAAQVKAQMDAAQKPPPPEPPTS